MEYNMAEACMLHGIAVMCEGRRYYRINALVTRKYIGGEAKNNKPPRQYAVLYDGVSNSVTEAPIKDIQLLPTDAQKIGGDA